MVNILLLLLAVFMILGLDMGLKTVHYQIKGDVNLKIAFISDLHGCYYGENMQTLVQTVEAEHPDVIVYTGDIFDDDLPFKNSILLLEQLKGYPSYYVNGNHEHLSGRMAEINQILTSNGVIVLDDKTDSMEKEGKKIGISGIEDPLSKKSLTTQLEQLKPEDYAYNILLAHRPENISQYLNYDFDLILSGHAHGGQWRIPYLLNGLFAPNQGLFPKYAGGLYAFGQTKFIVSRGLARESTRVPRFYNPPELVIIHIAKQ